MRSFKLPLIPCIRWLSILFALSRLAVQRLAMLGLTVLRLAVLRLAASRLAGLAYLAAKLSGLVIRLFRPFLIAWLSTPLAAT
jgi:hypothetical protein